MHAFCFTLYPNQCTSNDRMIPHTRASGSVPPRFQRAESAMVAEQIFLLWLHACQTAELRVDLHSTWKAQIFGATATTGHLVVRLYLSVK